MTDANNVDKKDGEITNEGVPVEPVDSERDEAEHRPKSFHVWLRKVSSNFKREGKPVVTPDPKQDRTRALVLLIGGIVGSILLFVGVFSTPPTKPNQAPRGRQPNLGRKDSTAPARLASPTPLLSAQTQSDESGQSPLSAADIQNTSPRHASGDQRPEEVDPEKSMERRNPVSSPVVRAPAKTINLVAAPVTYRYGASPDTAGSPGSEVPASFPEAVRSPSAKSSIVFIRSGSGTVGSSNSGVTEGNSDRPALLPPGSRLIARLESAVTSALKVPVVADIEYNYEKDGEILIPAGTKAIGELQQTATNGFVGIVFHSLQMPDGRSEPIEASAMDFRNEPLKGKVTGTNKGRKFLTRTLTGVGTIAAYVVGAGGSAIGQPITGGTLLRDRLAGNITSAGEQELTNAAFAQNIVVTVPAQTRFYIVFQKAAVEHVSAPPAKVTSGGTTMPTVQELRELMDLRREINQMYTESAVPQTSSAP
jgi:type IV secretory pathway VirB10-like protein